MARCLVALGANLGDPRVQLRGAVDRLAALPRVRVTARSAWHATAPVGGPPGQPSFLNGAVLLETQLSPHELLDAVLGIEADVGRVRHERWGARTLDIDLLVCGSQELSDERLTLPHPRLAFRRFVLEPACETAPWLVDPDSGWTLAALRDHLDRGVDAAAVAGDARFADAVVAALAGSSGRSGPPSVVRWSPRQARQDDAPRPKLILAPAGSSGSDRRLWRKMLDLPPTGPVAWLPADPAEALGEALAAAECVWPSILLGAAPAR